MARRVPTQARSKRRVAAILDAAAAEFAEVGFDAATMEAIAERADSSVGAVYQFFDNKFALFEAIAEGCVERSGEVFQSILTPELVAAGWKALVGGALDRYLEWERTDVHVRALYKNLHLYGTYEDADVWMMAQLVDQTASLITGFVPSMKPAKRKAVATTVVNTATAFLFLARQTSDREAKVLLEETKTMLLRYLEAYVEEG